MAQLQQLAKAAYRWRYPALLSAAGSFYTYQEYRNLQQLKEYEIAKEPKKLALTIPFDRLELVQKQKANPLRSLLKSLTDEDRSNNDSNATEKVTISVREMVDVIHTAAVDPHICALYGKFGTGLDTAMGGGERSWADLEEVRNALIVFSQSHRRHLEANAAHQTVVIPKIEPKALYCYADNLGSYSNPGNPQYYIASVFNKMHLQTNGELQLFGMLSTSFFLKGFLEKYGVQLHVFKHGDYKTAPNTLTEKKFTKAHKESTVSLVSEIDANVAMDITASRSKALLTSWLKGGKAALLNGSGSVFMSDNKVLQIWQRIHDSGTFPASTAWKAGLVDCLARRNPLDDLLAYNRAIEKGNDDEAKAIKARWQPQETDFGHFTATKAISLEEYRTKLAKMERIRAKREQLRESFQSVFGMDAALPSLLVGGKNEPTKPKDKRERVAYLDVVGTIDDKKAREVVAKLQHLKKNISKDDDDEDKKGDKKEKMRPKCLVLRIVSPGGQIFACETISQELRALDIPHIVSFGNVAASGGYYIAAGADRIFGSNKTLTGSIGVFGIRPDFTGLAKKYGIQVDHVAAGNLAGSYSPFTPMTRAMQYNMAHSVDQWYEQFKDVVQEGRDLDDVEELAQGKVWTGRQAKEVGLVDEIGGWDRAISYAKRVYCDDPEQVEVVQLGEVSFWTTLKDMISSSDPKFQDIRHFIFGMEEAVPEEDVLSVAGDFGQRLLKSQAVAPGTLSGIMMTMDENSALEVLLREYRSQCK